MQLKIKDKKIQYIIVFLSAIFVITAGYKLITWQLDSNEIKKQIDEIQKIETPEEINVIDEGALVNPPKDESNPYWDYIKMPMIDADFTELKKINPETKGWIQVLGTNINYPFVQHDDKVFYLDHSFNQKSNMAGWVFLDSRNDIETLDRNNIIYAHGMVNSVLFGTLKNINKENWFSNSNNHIIKISTESNNSLWQVFSIYRIPTTSDYIVTSFYNDKTYNNYLNFVKDRSQFDFNVELSPEDKILTLSTCYSYTDKMVMHAKLIKID